MNVNNNNSFFSTSRYISLTLSNTTGQGTALVQVPFMVKEIIVKQLNYQDSNAFTNLQSYGTVLSDIITTSGNNVLGVVNTTSTAGAGHQPNYINNRFCFKNPVKISGIYVFELRDFLGTSVFSGLTGTTNLSIFLEFIEYDVDTFTVS
jgi:hypothetical protein